MVSNLGTLDVDMPDVMSNATLTVTVRARRMWRVRLALVCIRLGCRIAGIQSVVVVDDGQ